MDHYVFFCDGGRNLFGELFGSAIEYKVEKDSKTYELRVHIKPKMLIPESIYHPFSSKFDIVCEFAIQLSKKIGWFCLEIYGSDMEISTRDSKEDIAQRIIDRQLSLVKVDESLDKNLQRQINDKIRDALREIDIY